MSSVRMCDRCGQIFSENADGWDTYTVNKKTRDEDGNVKVRTEVRDACPDCSIPDGSLTPRAAISAGGSAFGAGSSMTNIQSDGEQS